MNKSVTYKNLIMGGITTYYPDGSMSHTYMNLVDGGYTTYHPEGGRSVTNKNLFDGGYTTYHPDGSRSITYKNLVDGGYTTYHSDGSRSVTYKNLMDRGYTTYYLGDDDLGIGFHGKSSNTASVGMVGSKIEEISNELIAVDLKLSVELKNIEQECSKMAVAINEIQSAFGDQENGRILISNLYRAIKDLTDAEGMLFIAKNEVKDYIQRIRD